MCRNETRAENTDSRLLSDGGNERQYRNETFLREQYLEKCRSASDIAAICGVSSSTISRWLDRHGIEREPRYKQRDWLYDQYVNKGKYQSSIAAECGVAETTICHWLARHGITDGESFQRAECAECGSGFRYYPSVRDGEFCSNRCANKQRERQVEITCPHCEESFKRRQSLDTEYCSMYCWGQDTRRGASLESYYATHWPKQRERAIERDGYECSVCGISDDEHRNRFGRGLEVHHIVPIRLFAAWEKPPEDAHTLRNLITLCRTHHPDAPGKTVETDGDDSNLSKMELKELTDK